LWAGVTFGAVALPPRLTVAEFGTAAGAQFQNCSLAFDEVLFGSNITSKVPEPDVELAGYDTGPAYRAFMSALVHAQSVLRGAPPFAQLTPRSRAHQALVRACRAWIVAAVAQSTHS
jgi:hypothetical protein